jgi:hypothetical protein
LANSYSKCVDIALAAGKISKANADAIRRSGDPETAIKNVIEGATIAKRENAIQAIRIAEAWDDMQSFKSDKEFALLEALNSLMAKDPTGRAGHGKNVDKIAGWYRGKYQGEWDEALSHFRTRDLGWTQDTEGLAKLIKAIHGEEIDDPIIKKYADEWLVIVEKMRNDFNENGGSISAKEDFALPQSHDRRSILALGAIDPKTAKDFILGKVGDSNIDVDLARNRWKEKLVGKDGKSGMLDREKMLADEIKTGDKKEIDAAKKKAIDTENKAVEAVKKSQEILDKKNARSAKMAADVDKKNKTINGAKNTEKKAIAAEKKATAKVEKAADSYEKARWQAEADAAKKKVEAAKERVAAAEKRIIKAKETALDAKNKADAAKKKFDSLSKTAAEAKKQSTIAISKRASIPAARVQLTDEELDKALDHVFQSIITNGMNKVNPLETPSLGRKLSRKGSEKRFLHFKDGASWLAYQQELGKGDIFTTMTDHIESTSHDIALMKRFGTSPERTYEALLAMIENQPKKKTSVFSGVRGEFKRAFSRSLFNVVSGKVNGGEGVHVADFAQGVRNTVTSAILGKAMLSAISDTGFNKATTNFRNIEFTKVIQTQAKLMNPANEADRKLAVRMGLIADSWTGLATAGNRYSDMHGSGLSMKMAETVIRGSALATWTDAGRKAFGMEFSAMLADNFSKKYGELTPEMRGMFDEYGIDAKNWEAFRQTKKMGEDVVDEATGEVKKSAGFADLTTDEAEKFHQMIMSETDFAVPTPDSRVRAFTTGGRERGTSSGQLIRTGMMLTSFPITIAQTHLARTQALAATSGMDATSYLGGIMLSTTLMGSAALAFSDISAGREPRFFDPEAPMEQNLTLLKDSLIKGGSLSIFGDWALRDVNMYGASMADRALGPAWSLGGEVVEKTYGNIQSFVSGEETEVLSDVAKLAKRLTPSVWYTKLVTDSLLNHLAIMAEPSNVKSYQRQSRHRKKEYNQSTFISPTIINDNLK